MITPELITFVVGIAFGYGLAVLCSYLRYRKTLRRLKG